MASLPDSTEKLARRVIEEFTRSGQLPHEVQRELSVELWKKGSIRQQREAERKVFEWAERFCRELDNKKAAEGKPVPR